MTVDEQRPESVDRQLRVIAEHTGRPRLSWRAARAIRSATRARPRDAAVWLAAARCLRHTSWQKWAYRCYRRAARLLPEDLNLAEEIGMFGATVLRRVWSRDWPRYLVQARQDPARRPRVDPVLLGLARRLPAEASGLIAMACFLAMITGSWVVRRFQPIGRSLPDGFVPYPPYVGLLSALAALIGFGALFVAIVAPVKRFGTEILRRAWWPLRPVHVLALALAAVTVALTLVVGWHGAAPQKEFDTLALSAIGGYLATIVVAFLGLPVETRIEALVAAVLQLFRR